LTFPFIEQAIEGLHYSERQRPQAEVAKAEAALKRLLEEK